MDLSEIFNSAVPYIGAATAIIGAAITAKSAIYTNKQQQEVLITRFGEHIKTVKEPGLKIKAPFIDQVARRLGMDLLQSSDKLATKTKDDLFVELPITVQFQIEDSAKFHFKNRDGVANMMKVVNAAVRTATSGKQFQELYTDRDEISTAVINHIEKDVSDFGLKIRRIVIDEPAAPAEVQRAFNEVRASERLKEAAKNKADAHKIEIVAKAEADKQADILHGEGKAGFRQAIFVQYSDQMKKLEDAGASREEAVTVMMQSMQQDTLREIGEKGNMVIVTEGGQAGRNIGEMQSLVPALAKKLGAAAPAR